jgi:hydrogenase/urease accessory protein HupE
MRTRDGKRCARTLAGAGLAAALLAAPAHAHLVQTGFGDFYDGLAHLVLTPADLLLALGFGLLAGLRGRASARAALFALPLAWLAGGLVGTRLPTVGALVWATSLSAASAGLLSAADARLGRSTLVGLALLAGALHGLAGGSTLDADAPALSLAGTTLGVFALFALSSALVVSRSVPWQRVAMRVAGSWIAASGVLMCAWQARAGAAG